MSSSTDDSAHNPAQTAQHASQNERSTSLNPPLLSPDPASSVGVDAELPETSGHTFGVAANQIDESYSQAEDADESDLADGDDVMEDEEEGHTDRPNKYHGPAATWRDWTREERMLSASVDQIRAGDLSVHLYNAHQLKQRLRAPTRQKPKPWNNKKEWIDEERREEWYPDEAWTAWPLKNEDVPRLDERFSSHGKDEDDDWTVTAQHVDTKPSAELEELLIAVVLKFAKERFENREEDMEENLQETESVERGGDGESEGASLSQSHASVESQSGEDFKSNDESGDEGNEHNNTKDVSSANEALVSNLTEEEDLGPPVPMADDEKAQQILTPTVRSLLAKFEVLLMGLHHACQAYASEKSALRKPKQKASTEKNKSAQPIQRQESGFASSESRSDEASSSATSLSASSSPSPSSSFQGDNVPSASPSNNYKGPSRIPPRDWSDVLGVASMQGWSSAVIQRTAQRCADLFGEEMSFMTLHENVAGTANPALVTYRPSSMVPFSSASQDAPVSTSETRSLGLRLPLMPGSLSCPYPDCIRHDDPYPALRRLRQYMKRTHGYDPKEAQAEEEDGEMVGGVHVDGFLRPIQASRGWRGKDVKKRKAKEPVGGDNRIAKKKRKVTVEDDARGED